MAAPLRRHISLSYQKFFQSEIYKKYLEHWYLLLGDPHTKQILANQIANYQKMKYYLLVQSNNDSLPHLGVHQGIDDGLTRENSYKLVGGSVWVWILLAS